VSVLFRNTVPWQAVASVVLTFTHVANISTAIQTADAQTILNAASARMLRVSFGVM
jgi:hypothetical protein